MRLPACTVLAGLAALIAAGALTSIPGALAAPANGRPVVAPGPNGTVVHIGDSFLDAGLHQALKPRFQAEQTKYFKVAKTRAWIATFAYGSEIEAFRTGYQPSLYLITVGANDLVYPRPEERVKVVRDLVQKIGGRPCVWISTPLWRGAPTAYVDMIRRECAPCRHFDSETVNARITRQPDGRHPDTKGGAVWAEAFWTWLQAERAPVEGNYWALKPAPPEEHAPRDPSTPTAASAVSATPAP
ncbi:MAG TPA: SGNH/GDSL hydrolase family protein [Polyangiaceae bacterium]|nr:SGNH/GDSL hydrolase family protein [Polyangiaceae bacterium]